MFQSALSKAFNSYKYIETRVNITEFIKNAPEIPVKEELVTSTSEFIKNIRREAYKQLKVDIVQKPGFDLIL